MCERDIFARSMFAYTCRCEEHCTCVSLHSRLRVGLQTSSVWAQHLVVEVTNNVQAVGRGRGWAPAAMHDRDHRQRRREQG